MPDRDRDREAARSWKDKMDQVMDGKLDLQDARNLQELEDNATH
jgi:hypothetical protein